MLGQTTRYGKVPSYPSIFHFLKIGKYQVTLDKSPVSGWGASLKVIREAWNRRQGQDVVTKF
jgi:hypothetical protein